MRLTLSHSREPGVAIIKEQQILSGEVWDSQSLLDNTRSPLRWIAGERLEQGMLQCAMRQNLHRWAESLNPEVDYVRYTFKMHLYLLEPNLLDRNDTERHKVWPASDAGSFPRS